MKEISHTSSISKVLVLVLILIGISVGSAYAETTVEVNIEPFYLPEAAPFGFSADNAYTT